MDALCYPIDVTTTDGDSPAAVGNRIAAAVLAAGLADGSNEAGGYADPDYKPVNPPLVVNQPGTTMTDPNRWQPLQIEHMISQNGIPVTNGVQQAVGPHWGHVTTFALPPGGPTGVPVDPGRRRNSATRPPTRPTRTRPSRSSATAACSTRRRQPRSTSRPARAAATRSAPTTGLGIP